jgi:hypothetical protein
MLQFMETTPGQTPTPFVSDKRKLKNREVKRLDQGCTAGWQQAQGKIFIPEPFLAHQAGNGAEPSDPQGKKGSLVTCPRL